ncbi:MAG: CBS domain-containing protein [Thermonemataceae bacterium]
MIAYELIDKTIPKVQPSDTIQDVINWTEELKVSQLPTVNEEGIFITLLDEDTLYNHPNATLPVESLPLLQQSTHYVKADQHYLDLLRLAHQQNLEVIPVIDETGRLLGSVRIQDVVQEIAKTYAVQQQGGILVLAMQERDYSLAEISRLVESNNAKVLSSLIEFNEHNKLEILVTLKIDQIDLSHIVATFERFNYKVQAKFQTTELVNVDQTRLDLLLKYLEM